MYVFSLTNERKAKSRIQPRLHIGCIWSRPPIEARLWGGSITGARCEAAVSANKTKRRNATEPMDAHIWSCLWLSESKSDSETSITASDWIGASKAQRFSRVRLHARSWATKPLEPLNSRLIRLMPSGSRNLFEPAQPISIPKANSREKPTTLCAPHEFLQKCVLPRLIIIQS